MKHRRIITYIGLIIVSFIIISISGANAKFTYNSAIGSVSNNQNNLKPSFNMNYDGDDVDEDGKIQIENLYFEDKAIPYDGKGHSLLISGNLPEGVRATYINNGPYYDVGTYEITVTFSDSTGKYLVPNPMTAKLTIYEQDDYELEFFDTYVNIIKYNGTKLSSLVVPSVFYKDDKEFEVKKICRESSSENNYSQFAFQNHNELERITLPSSIEMMEKGIFSGCKSLVEISIPFIGRTKNDEEYSHMAYMFGQENYYNTYSVSTKLSTLKLTNCDNLLNNSLYGIKLTCITLPGTLTLIESGVFDGCAFEEVYYTEKIENWSKIEFKSLSSNPMSNCVENAKFYILKKEYEYYGYKEPENVTVSNEVENLTYTFCNFKSIETVYLPDSVKIIGDNTFEGCSSLKSININSNIKIIGQNAFKDCTAIKEIKVPDNVKTIGIGAFEGCTSLESITLPFIGGSRTENTIFAYIFGRTSQWGENDIPSSVKIIIITEGIEEIPYYAFNGLSYVENIVVPSTITKIDEDVFHKCYNLKSIYFSGSEEQWNSIKIDDSNYTSYATGLKNAVIYYYSPSNPNQDGNYWYYDENNNIKYWNSKEENNK